MYTPDDELARRMTADRPDHRPASPATIAFMTARHHQRHADALRLGLPILDTSQTADEIYKSLVQYDAQHQ